MDADRGDAGFGSTDNKDEIDLPTLREMEACGTQPPIYDREGTPSHL